eukprot:TRINITY_DN501_c0_g1_i10.p1 TRINITY_DN501_c0_g1~~TRINITY_DN501_c0_g1_i10.p1  ORF type:complete len:241 (+),score=66.26 TRINITY_DN501_c0_g1_i10:186-908(+)
MARSALSLCVKQLAPSLRLRSLHSTPARFGGHGISVHRPTPDNQQDTEWDFTDANWAQLQVLIAKYPPNCQAGACIPALDLAQRQQGEDGRGGWLPVSAMNKVAEALSMPPIRVYEVASFYTMFNREKVGKYLIQICGTTPCQLNGAERIIDTIEEQLGVKTGGTSADGLFTTMEVECLGACVNAPMVQINDDFYEDLTEETVSYTHLRAHETPEHLVCRLLLEKKKKKHRTSCVSELPF